MTDESPRSRLTGLQRELLDGFFRHEQRFFLTGGAALVGYYLQHRATDDLDFFAAPGPDLADAERALLATCAELGATAAAVTSSPDFRRYRVTRGSELCVVDLVIDRAPALEVSKNVFGQVVVDTPREILANKICALIGRSAIRDLVDLRALLESGQDLELAFADAAKKDGGADPATLGWVLDQMKIGDQALLPGGVDPKALEQFRVGLVKTLRDEAWLQQLRRAHD
jgi:predicted nucleotidyltransferase component of viral defense system